ncbi:MAG: hypothetical protein P8Z81_16320 [Deinococcales bacterium]
MTIVEYATAPWWKRVGYRIFRHPLFLFGIAPTFIIRLPAILLAASAGTWLFYAQHRYERTY